MTIRTRYERFRSRLPRARSTAWLKAVRGRAEQMRTLSDVGLASAADSVREAYLRDDEAVESVDQQSFGLVCEAVRRRVGVELFDTQLLAARAMTQGCIAEMQTGEGKTLAALPAAVVGALRGTPVHVVTPNIYLARRDHEEAQPVLELLGVSTARIVEPGDELPDLELAKQQAYNSEVAYGTGYELGFDYLREQSEAVAHASATATLGSMILQRLSGNIVSSSNRQQHGLAIVDEADHVLVDDADSPLILSQTPSAAAPDAVVHQFARRTAAELEDQKHFVTAGERTRLTKDGLRHIHRTADLPIEHLRRPWAEYVEQALKARLGYHRDVHYVVQDQQIRIVDPGTGRVFSDRSWSDGLHQAIEAKEDVPVTSERTAIASITRQRYFQRYAALAGMTGTAEGCERELQQVYGAGVRLIPRRRPSRVQHLRARAFVDRDAKWSAILNEVQQVRRAGRPVLIGTRNIADSIAFADGLTKASVSFQLLNGCQDAQEAEVIADAGHSGCVTIATNLAGRGTDIRLSESARAAGGLHVIVSQPHEIQRVDRQLAGRCGRQGDPGSVRMFVSADDQLIENHGRWLQRPMQRAGGRDGEVSIDLSERIRGLQTRIERQRSMARRRMLQRDLARINLMSGIEPTSDTSR